METYILMTSDKKIYEDSNINLKDIFFRLWAYKLLIISMCGFAILCGGLVGLDADKRYSSKAVFKISKKTSPGFKLGGEIGALASIAGIGGQVGSSGPGLSTEEIKGRVFIEKIDKTLDFKSDKYFYKKVNINSKDPVWKATIKHLIGYKREEVDLDEAAWQKIVRVYKKNVSVDISTKNDTISVSVKHENPDRAAKIANTIMETILLDFKKERENDTKGRLVFLSTTMADALDELESAQEKLKTFALENSALALENFAAESLKLDALRYQYDQAVEFYNAASEIKIILGQKVTGEAEYLYLSNKFPVVDQREFRRMLGQQLGQSSTWKWPDSNSVVALIDTLSERMKNLKLTIETSQKTAESSGESLTLYAKLKREEKIAEATYTVLIEQVKALSMTAAYDPDSSAIYDYAVPAVSHSTPNLLIYIVISAFIGFVISILLSLCISFSRGVYYSNQLLITDAKADFVVLAKSLNSLRNKNINQLKKSLIKKPKPIIRDLIVEINKNASSFVLVSSSYAKLKSNQLARVVSSYMEFNDTCVAIINFSNRKPKNNNDQNDIIGQFRVVEVQENVKILEPDNNKIPIDYLTQRDFSDNLKLLEKSFDIIFICADNSDSLSLCRAAQFQDVYHVMLSRNRFTKCRHLSQLVEIKKIQGLLYV